MVKRRSPRWNLLFNLPVVSHSPTLVVFPSPKLLSNNNNNNNNPWCSLSSSRWLWDNTLRLHQLLRQCHRVKGL
jgi:hypothetical protein